MNNLMPPHKDIHGLYDLKGSTVGRDYPEAKLKEKLDAGEMHPTLKDLNWLRRSLNVSCLISLSAPLFDTDIYISSSSAHERKMPSSTN